MNCADRYEVQRRIEGLENSRDSRRTTLDHAIVAADTAAVTPATPEAKAAGWAADS